MDTHLMFLDDTQLKQDCFVIAYHLKQILTNLIDYIFLIFAFRLNENVDYS